MICLIALIVFGILGIFSVSHRKLAKEAFHCIFRRVTLRRCDTGFDQKMKAKITGKLLKRNPKIARFTYKNFEAISWVFTILFISSLVFSANGLYNLTKYGSCDPHSTECIFNPGELGCGGESCQEECLCEKEVCESPAYKACQGDCDCQREVCG